jgi:sialic acid synthase SpsE
VIQIIMGDIHCQSFCIGQTVVGLPGFVYVIAEAGVNHDGDVCLARELVSAAAQAGADAVKFQVFSADRLVTRQALTAAYQQHAGEAITQQEMLARLELEHGQFADLARYARQCGIEFLATPFSVVDLEFLVSIDVPALKLAATDIINGPLIDAAARSRRPVIASTGAADSDEIEAAVERYHRPGAGPLALLHCISSYPAREETVNLAAIATLARRFDCVTGFSDHTESVTMGGYAAAAGARIIEKHFTLDRSRSGPDHAFSLEPDDMAGYIQGIRYAARLLGDGQPGCTESQREVRELSRASVVAARDIRAGETLTQAMLTTRRPGSGISPMDIDALLGQRVIQPIPADTAVTWEVLSPMVAAL